MDDMVMRFLRPTFFPPTDSKERWVIFLDEMNIAPDLVQKAAYQLVLDRKVGEYKLPKLVSIIAAGNRPEDRAGVRDMPAPLANRFMHLEVDLSLDDWRQWAMLHGVSSETIGFLTSSEELLYKFDPARDKRGFPTPRSITAADATWQRWKNKPYVMDLVEGHTGKEYASKFQVYLQIYKELPTLAEMLEGPKLVAVPTRSDLRLAMAVMIGNGAQVKHLETALGYANAMPPDVSVLLIKLLLGRGDVMRRPMLSSPNFTTWRKHHQEFTVR
jgi:hypothetical protein